MPFIKRDTHKCPLPDNPNDYPDAEWYCGHCFKVWTTVFLRPDIDLVSGFPRRIQATWIWQWTGKVMDKHGRLH